MEVFQNLEILLGSITAEEMIKKIDALLPSTWSRDKKREDELMAKFGDNRQYSYSTLNNPDLPKARLWLAENEDGNLYVSNIVPHEFGQLTKKEYNNILLSFVAVLQNDLSIKYKLSKDNVTLEDLVPQQVAQKLQQFSHAANKSTGIGHPCDRERWMEFVVFFYNNRCEEEKIYLIERWLHEEAGWTIESASELAGQLEYGLDVLKHYNKVSG